MSTSPCSRCGQLNEDGARFCASCGASLTPQVHCAACNALNPLGNRFCMQCGGSLGAASWGGAATGGVMDGVWERGPDEVVRKVEPEDARRFLGGRVVRVPPGTVGVVVVDGVVDRVLPPGERTTLSLFERIAAFFGRADRSAFYLVDQRPIPVPFIVQTRPASSGRVTKTQVLVSFHVPRGDRAALGNFLANVVGGRAGYGAQDLYNLLRPEVVRTSQEVLERLAGEGETLTYAEAEARIRAGLEGLITPRYGLVVEATVAPLTSVQSLSFHLGTGVAPRVRACVSCRREVPVALKFCDACGARQPVFTSAAGAMDAATALFSSDGEQVELDLVVRVQGQHDDFSPQRITPALVGAAAAHLREVTMAQLASGAGFTAAEQALADAVKPALEAYGLQLVELSVVDARTKTGAWLLSARADLERAKADVLLGREVLGVREQELDLEGLTLAQALAAQAKRRDHELAAAFAKDEAALADRSRREALDELKVALELGDAERRAKAQARLEALEREADRRREAEARADALRREAEARADALRRAAERREDVQVDAGFAHDEALTRQARELELAAARQVGQQALQGDAQAAELALRAEAQKVELGLQTEAQRAALALEAERRRQAIELAAEEERTRLAMSALAEAQQLDKLRAMAELDRQMAEQEHTQTLAKRQQLVGLTPEQMIAAQAAELAASGQGDAWAAALSQRAVADAEARHAEVLAKTYDKAMDAMSRVAASRAEPAPVAAQAPVVAVAQHGGEAVKACRACGNTLRPDAGFCGRCGADQRGA